MTNDQRSGQRHRAYLAAEIVIDRKQSHSAVTKDISSEGLLLLTRARLEADQRVKLRIHRPGKEDRPVVLSGTVLRRQRLTPDEIGTWREKVAIGFDKPQPKLAREFEALAAKQARLSSRPAD